jgi:hypothetical protein
VRRLTFGIVALVPIAALVGAVWWVRSNEKWHDETLAAAKELLAKRDDKRAQPLLAQLARRFPEEMEIQYLLGQASFRLRERVMALTTFESVLRSSPTRNWARSISSLIHTGVSEKVAGPLPLRELPMMSSDGSYVILDPAQGTERQIVAAARDPDAADSLGETSSGGRLLLFARRDTGVSLGAAERSLIVRAENGTSRTLRAPAQALAGSASQGGRAIVYLEPIGRPDGGRSYRLGVLDADRGTDLAVWSSGSPLDLLWVSGDATRAVVWSRPSLGYEPGLTPTSVTSAFYWIDLASRDTTGKLGFAEAALSSDTAAASDGENVAAVAQIGGKRMLFAGKRGTDVNAKKLADVAGNGTVRVVVSGGRAIVATTGERQIEISSYDLATGKKERLTRVNRPTFGGIAFSRDGRLCAYTAMSRGEAASGTDRQVICLLETDTGRNFLLLTPKIGAFDDICSLDISDDGRVVTYCIGKGRVAGQEEWPTHSEYEVYTFDMARVPDRAELSKQLYMRLGRVIYSP